MAFQEALIAGGWLSRGELEATGEYGTMGDMTYAAVYEVQLWYTDNETGGEPVQFVRDAGGSFRDGTGAYYPVDETTYDYIMKHLPVR